MEYQGIYIGCCSIIVGSLFSLFDGYRRKEITTYLQNNFPLFLKNVYLQIT